MTEAPLQASQAAKTTREGLHKADVSDVSPTVVSLRGSLPADAGQMRAHQRPLLGDSITDAGAGWRGSKPWRSCGRSVLPKGVLHSITRSFIEKAGEPGGELRLRDQTARLESWLCDLGSGLPLSGPQFPQL